MALELSKADLLVAETLAADAGVSVPVLVAGLLRWTAVLHDRTDALEDDERDPHPADRPIDEKPTLSPLLEALRVQCDLYISAVSVGREPSGPLWLWKMWNSSQEELPAAIEHDHRTLDKNLLDFLTGYALGMKAIPF